MDPSRSSLRVDVVNKLNTLDTFCDCIAYLLQKSLQYIEDKVNQNHCDLADVTEKYNKLTRKPILKFRNNRAILIYNHDEKNIKHLIGKGGRIIQTLTRRYKIKINVPSNCKKPISVLPLDNAEALLFTKGGRVIFNILNNGF